MYSGLDIWFDFNQCLEKVTLPSSLRSLTFGVISTRALTCNAAT